MGRIYTITIFHRATVSPCVSTAGEASAAQAALAVREGLSLLGMNHANVLSVVGAACDGQPLLLYPYMNAGNLKRFLNQADQV